MKLSSHKKVLAILILALSTLGCKFMVWSYLDAATRSSRRECNQMGGEWIIDRENWTGRCEFPEFERDEKPDHYDPREEDAGPALNDALEQQPAADQPDFSEGNAEACIASPATYEIQISEPQYYQNEGFDGCESRMIIRNLSENTLRYTIYTVSTLHPEDEGWRQWELDPSITDTHEHRFWSETHKGETTGLTVSQIVFSAAADECSNYLDEGNQSQWENYIVLIDDPCSP